MTGVWMRIHCELKPMAALFFFGLIGLSCGAGHSFAAESAKAEGEFVWWTTIAQDQSQKIIEAFMKKRKAADNPWGVGATTLEWTLSSPPPFHQFNELPRIK